MKTNFHTHTFRCGHADNEEAMVKSTIEEGIEVLDFSEHVRYRVIMLISLKECVILLIIFVYVAVACKQSLLMVLQCECHIKISSCEEVKRLKEKCVINYNISRF